MKNVDRLEDNKAGKGMGPKRFDISRKKNIRRLGGGGLSLEAFANTKSTSHNYNPALIKKRREFYKNAKFVKKYKKSLKQQAQESDTFSMQMPPKAAAGSEDVSCPKEKGCNKSKKKKSSLEDIYSKKREEEEKARIEREAMIRAKREAREKHEAKRKAGKEKMMKKTRHGQPVMKYRIEHLLESIQNTVGTSMSK